MSWLINAGPSGSGHRCKSPPAKQNTGVSAGCAESRTNSFVGQLTIETTSRRGSDARELARPTNVFGSWKTTLRSHHRHRRHRTSPMSRVGGVWAAVNDGSVNHGPGRGDCAQYLGPTDAAAFSRAPNLAIQQSGNKCGALRICQHNA